MSDKFDHHFFMKQILQNIINLNDLWLGYGKQKDYPNNGFFIGDEY